MSQSPTSNSANARRYWRSTDELAEAPEFKDWLHREFPANASEVAPGVLTLDPHVLLPEHDVPLAAAIRRASSR